MRTQKKASNIVLRLLRMWRAILEIKPHSGRDIEYAESASSPPVTSTEKGKPENAPNPSIDPDRQSKEFLDSVFENIPNMIFIKDAQDLRFIRFNKAGADLLGVRPQDLIGKNDYDLFPESQAAFFTRKDREALLGGTVVDIPEEPIQVPTGTRYLHTKKIPLHDSQGNPIYLLGISEDITERKLAEIQRTRLIKAQAAQVEAEKISERLRIYAEASSALTGSMDLQAVLDGFGAVIVQRFADWCVVELFNNQGQVPHVISVNHYDARKKELLRQWALSHPTPLYFALAPLAEERPSTFIQGSDSLTSKILTSDEIHIEPTLEQIGIDSLILLPLVSQGSVMGSISFITSGRAPHYTEADFSVASELARRVSATIENISLFIRAQEASRSKSAFLANMSHEIRTPLGAMLGFTELALDEPSLSQETMDNLNMVLRNGRELLRIVDEILDLSKIESSHVAIELRDFSVRSLLDEIRKLFELKASAKNLDFEIRIDDDVPTNIFTDRSRLRQILINLLGNAIKFTERGFVRMTVSARKPEDSKDVMIEFIISDSGIGISEEQQTKLFEAFVQADSSMTRRFGGTGLGLFVSRKLARLLGGDLRITRSSPSEGTTFALTIQGSTVQDSITTVSSPTVPAPTSSTPPVRRAAHVLLVDDSIDNRLLFSRLLGKEGVNTQTVESGTKALEAAQTHSFDLVFMDLQMPDMDGFATLERLRAQGYQKPVIALTAHAMKGDRERCIERGFSDYLTKPIDKEKLRSCLIKFLSLEELSPSDPLSKKT